MGRFEEMARALVVCVIGACIATAGADCASQDSRRYYGDDLVNHPNTNTPTDCCNFCTSVQGLPKAVKHFTFQYSSKGCWCHGSDATLYTDSDYAAGDIDAMQNMSTESILVFKGKNSSSLFHAGSSSATP